MIVAVRMFYANSQGKRAQNVMHFEPNGSLSLTDPFIIAQHVANGFLTNMQTALLACLCADTNFDAITGKVVDGTGGPTFSTAISGAGTEAGNSLSMIVAANIAMLPAAPPFARKEGHIYVPAMPENFCDGDLIQAAGFAAYQAFITDLTTGIVTGGATWFPVIYDRTTKTGSAVGHMLVRPNVSGHKRRIRPVTS